MGLWHVSLLSPSSELRKIFYLHGNLWVWEQIACSLACSKEEFEAFVWCQKQESQELAEDSNCPSLKPYNPRFTKSRNLVGTNSSETRRPLRVTADQFGVQNMALDHWLSKEAKHLACTQTFPLALQSLMNVPRFSCETREPRVVS